MIEKHLPTRINYDDTERDLHPGEYRDALNISVFSENDGGLRKSLAVGNVKLASFPGLVAGAKSIGTALNIQKAKSILFFHQTGYLWMFEVDFTFALTAPIVTKLLSSANMGVTASSFLNGFSFIDNLIYFNFPGTSPKVINIQRAKDSPGFYDLLPEEVVSVIKPTSAYNPLAVRASGAPATNPPILRKAFQFAVILIYVDGERSVLSPASEYLNYNSDENPGGTQNLINVTIRMQATQYPLVESVELFARNSNNISDWRSIEVVDKNLFSLSGQIYSYVYPFDDSTIGAFLAVEDAAKLNDSVPRKTTSFAGIDSRLFALDSLIDYTPEDTWAFVIATTNTPSQPDQRSPAGFTLYSQNTFQFDSEYSVGIVFKDKFLRRIPLSTEKRMVTPLFQFIPTPVTDGFPVSLGAINTATVTITGPNGTGNGVPPSFAYYYNVAVSKNLKWEFQVMTKCVLRFPYSITAWTGSTLPANTFLEDGYLYWDFESLLSGSSAITNTMANAYIDVVIPPNFPYSIDANVLIDFALKLNSGVAYNAITISNREVIAIFSNKIRIRGDLDVRWIKASASVPGIFRAFPKFTSGVNLVAGQTLLQNEIAMPVIIKRRATQTPEIILYDEPNTLIISTPGTPTRSFGGAGVIQEDTYLTTKGAANAAVPLVLQDTYITPFHLIPDTSYSNHRIRIEWAASSADANLWTISVQLMSLDQVTKQPLSILSQKTGSAAQSSTVEYLISDGPSLNSGWYGFGFRLTGNKLLIYSNQSFDNGLTGWIFNNGSVPSWEAGNDGVDFYAVMASSWRTNLIPGDWLQFCLGQSYTGPYNGVVMEVDIESVGIEGPPATTPLDERVNPDAGTRVAFLSQEYAIVPIQFTFGSSSEKAFIKSILVSLGDYSGTTLQPKASGQLWALDQITKKPIALIAETQYVFLTPNAAVVFTFDTPVELITSGYYGFGMRVIQGVDNQGFLNPTFANDGQYWINAGGSALWDFNAPTGKASCQLSAGQNSAFLGQNIPAVNGKRMSFVFNLEPGSADSQVHGNFYVYGSSGEVVGATGIFLQNINAPFTVNIDFTANSGAVKIVYFLTSGTGRVSISQIAIVDTSSLIFYHQNVAPVLSWIYRTGEWQELTGLGLGCRTNYDRVVLAPASNIAIRPQDLSGTAVGAEVAVAPNTRTTVNLPFTSLPASGVFGISVKNNAANTKGKGEIRIHSLRNVKTLGAPPAITSYAVAGVPEHNIWRYPAAGPWAKAGFVSGFSVKVDDIIYGVVTPITLLPSCYNLAQNYLVPGSEPTHSIDWTNPQYAYDSGFVFPSVSSDPDAVGIVYAERSGWSIGIPNIQISNQKESNQGNVVRWSDTIVQYTRKNDLNSFREQNKFVVDYTRGPINKLLAMNDNTLLCIHRSTMTSLYLRRFVVRQAGDTGNTLALADSEVGDQRQLFTNMGTINPESCIVVEAGTVAYGFDLIRASFWRKTNNGVEDLTMIGKMQKWFLARCSIRLEAINDGVDIKIYTGYSKKSKNVYLTLAKFTYKGVDYPEETICWNDFIKGFVSRHSFYPDAYMEFGNYVTSVKAESSVVPPDLWVHETSGYMNKYYNSQFFSTISLIIKQNDDIIRLFNNIGIDSGASWSVLSIKTSEGGESALDLSNFTNRDGRFYASFLRDTTTPQDSLQAGQTPLIHGNKLTGRWINIELKNVVTTERIVLNAVYVGYDELPGHIKG